MGISEFLWWLPAVTAACMQIDWLQIDWLHADRLVVLNPVSKVKVNTGPNSHTQMTYDQFLSLGPRGQHAYIEGYGADGTDTAYHGPKHCELHFV